MPKTKSKKSPVKTARNALKAGTYRYGKNGPELVELAPHERKTKNTKKVAKSAAPGGHKSSCWPKEDDLCTPNQKKKFADKLIAKGITPDLYEEGGRVKIRIPDRAARKRIYEALGMVDRDAGMAGDPKPSAKHERLWKQDRQRKDAERAQIDADNEFIREFESHGQGIVDIDELE